MREIQSRSNWDSRHGVCTKVSTYHQRSLHGQVPLQLAKESTPYDPGPGIGSEKSLHSTRSSLPLGPQEWPWFRALDRGQAVCPWDAHCQLQCQVWQRGQCYEENRWNIGHLSAVSRNEFCQEILLQWLYRASQSDGLSGGNDQPPVSVCIRRNNTDSGQSVELCYLFGELHDSTVLRECQVVGVFASATDGRGATVSVEAATGVEWAYWG